MLKAKNIMTSDCITLTPETDIATAARTLLENKINGAPVVENGQVVGVLCQADLIAQQKKSPCPRSSPCSMEFSHYLPTKSLNVK